MKYHLAEINVAQFRLPIDHPVNTDFVANLDRVNTLAEAQPGFVWRLKGDGNNATDLKVFDDPNIITNMSVWTDLEALANFVYRNEGHREIMRRRREWFDRMDIYLALWWIPEGHIPTVIEGRTRLDTLKQLGPSSDAFLFGRPFPPPNTPIITPAFDECA